MVAVSSAVMTPTTQKAILALRAEERRTRSSMTVTVDEPPRPNRLRLASRFRGVLDQSDR